ncbi:type I polyketide synthase [Streptomyces sp. 11-1-2]|uniref:type I polyketide synthase n=1 Tax=Streptomyces sp. 11-1-2 TaxID=1851167 RepID=UPI0019691A1C|nr:type I polyketide synthase [Streptomyces sp. 11-1-2]
MSTVADSPWHHHFHDSVAVIGFSCRLPGARTPEEFWRLLNDGADTVTSVPEDRWAPHQSGGGSGPEAEAGMEFGAFLDRVDHFDADFFGISPREAAVMDPQQRLMLELGWETLEDAGLTPARIAQGRTGVFVGAINDDYATLLRRHGDSAVTHHTLTGLQRGMIANRLSYLLRTRGPSMVVDSGQSSSLVAVHTACQSLRNGECDTALAGGVHLNLAYDGALSAARFGGLSPDGRCFTFDARANGFVRGEGGGLVLLKPLARALADGDRIHGVLRGGAVNNDGGGDSLTTPSRTAQEEVLRRAYAAAGVGPDEVQYVELHGTGTAVGDPIEAAALAEVVGTARTKDRPLLVGSAKTNVGHLEGAAGITGLIKVLLCLKAAHLPPSLNFHTPNPAIPLEEWNLRVQTELSAWPRPDAPLIAGVSSFGVGGTNAHVIVERAPAARLAEGGAGVRGGVPGVRGGAGGARSRVPYALAGGVLPWVVSGRSAAGVRAQAARLREFTADGEVSPADIAWSLAEHRTALEHRAVVVAGDRDGFLAGLDALASGEPSAHVVNGVAASESTAGPVFVFPGQGSQWVGMAAELLDVSPVFAASIDRCARALAPHTDWDLLDVLRETEDGAALERAEVLQPALWAVMVSLTRVWRSLGVVPSVVVGHSQGEIAAACAAGALSLEDGARLIAVRSRLAGALIGRGGLASIGASAERAAELFAGRDDVWIAAVNGPGATVVGGSLEGLAEVMARAEAAGLRHRAVATAYASHTPHVEAIREEFLRLAAPIAPRAGDVPMYSTVTAAPIAGEALDAAYWYRNLREQVRFHGTVQRLIADGNSFFLESSSHPVLATAVQETGGLAVGTLRRGEGDTRRLLLSLAQLWVYGAAPDWATVFAGTGARRAELPGRAFQRRRHWFDTVASPAATDRAPGLAPDLAQGLDVAHQVRAQAAAVLGHTTAAELDTGRTFKDLGFDSISLSDLCNRINTALGTRLSPAALFSHPTPARLAEHLAATTSTSAAGPAPSGAPPAPAAATGRDEPIAIIAMSCRLPGGVRSPEDLWRLVADGRDAISPFPDDRGWDLERLHAAEGAGSSFARSGGFIDGATDFDARFFGISPREALAMDPQQRLLLETSWELLERAGIAPGALRASRTGVFVGTMDQEYGPRLHEAPEAVDGYLLTGKTASVASGRIAYLLGLTGPAITLDTACSSSLVALHLAVQSLRRGESSLALAGGVTVLNTPGIFTEFSRQGGLSRDGRCRAFAAGADGTGMAEGVGMLLVERLSDARRNGRRVLGVIRGTAVNQDGASNGLTAPNGLSQEQVVRQALADAHLTPSDVDLIEAHGTGTALGDPIEAQALLATYGRNRPDDRPVLLGSVKSNIGHTQAAAGVAGVIKSVMAMRHGVVPATLHVDEPTPHVDWASGGVELVTEGRPWPEAGRARRAGVSSFGISGTNAHVVLEEPPPAAVPSPAARPATSAVSVRTEGVLPWVVSGRTPAALRAQAARLREFTATASDASPSDVGWALATQRAALEHRAVVVAGDRDDFLAGLDAIASREPAGQVIGGAVQGASEGAAGPVFVFPGQGSQWVGMAAELLVVSPVFAESIDRCAQALAPHIGWDLLDVLRETGDDAALERVDVVQPALWAVMVSLAQVWRSLGVEPSAVVGHSQGEIAAACVAGVLSLEDGARLVALRSRLIARELAGLGGMVSLATSTDQAHELLTGRDDVWIAAVNGPTATVVAGSPTGLSDVMAQAEATAIRARAVAVDYASHTPHVERIREQLLQLAAPITPRTGDIPMYSTVTATPVNGTTLDAEYWYRNLRQPVRLHHTLQALLGDGHTRFLESSAHPVLTTAVEETGHAADRPVLATGTLRRDHGGVRQLLGALATLWAHGVDPDWTAVFASGATALVDLPTYAFQRERYWLTPIGPASAVRVDLPSAAATEGPEAAEGPEALDGFARRVTDAAEGASRLRVALDEVCRHAAAVLGLSSVGEVETRKVFRDLGFDSLTAVELRNRLATATGAALAPSVVFDHPTPLALAEHLLDRITGRDTAGADPYATGAVVPGAVVPGAAAMDEPIAIVATSCRFPAGVRSPEDLWRLLMSDQDTLSPFPADRGWDLDALYHPDPERPGSSYVHQGGFLPDAADFDADFFGISPREATAMDPQQRLLLETSWEALEHAGIDPLSLRGSRTGVFIGLVPHGYGGEGADTKGAEGYLFTGAAGSVASGRVAYSLGLTGPAVTVDTACSSSLVALHLAVQALRNGDCGMALVGGVSVISTPGVFSEFSHQRGLAPDGRCKPFAAAADGTAWAEGAGVLLVERLSEARRNGHQVLAVVRGSAVNQDGASNGLTAPNGPAQQAVVRQALANARLTPSDVDVIEAHGTGTALGDPIEAQALLATYGQDRSADRPALLGSMKAHVGHTGAAAGVAGIIKMVLALRHGVVPRTLHVDEPTPQVDWASGAVTLVTTNTRWPEAERARRAAVSSFGVSGTNAHVILEAAPRAETTTESTPTEGALPWVISARSEPALRAQAAQLRAFAATSDRHPADIGWTLAQHRAALEHRAVVVAADRDTFLAGLDAIATGEPAAHVVSGVAPAEPPSGAVFVFPGQGSQWVGMAAELLTTTPVFAESIDQCAQALAPHIDWNLLDVLREASDDTALERVDVVQPALWAVMVSLAQVWRSLGIEPSAVIGHSQGEIAAACVAGALTLEDGARLIALRSRLIAEELAGHGGMVSLTTPADQAHELLTGHDDVWIATVNGPTATVIAGTPTALTDVMAQAEATGIRARAIAVDYASHTPHVERIRDQLLQLAAPITPRTGDIPMYSTVTATPIDGATLDAEYWYRNLRQPVRFHQTLHTLQADGHTLYLETSPHPVLTTAIQETGTHATGTLRRNHGGLQQLLTTLATLWTHGLTPNWPTLLTPHTPTPTNLPTYPFQRHHYWLDTAAPHRHRDTAGPDAHAGFWAVVEREDLEGLARTLRLEESQAELTTLLPALSAWHRRQSAASTMDAWRYREDWRPLPETTAPALSGTWLVVLAPEQKGGALHEAVATALNRHGAMVETVVVAPDDPRRWADTLAALAPHTTAPVVGVLSLLARDEAAGLHRTLRLIQGLEAAGLFAPLWCVTQGAVSVGGHDPLTGPAQALVWGLGRVAAQELATRWGGLVDLPQELDERTTARLCAVLAAGAHEDQVAVRAAGILGRRIVRAPRLGDVLDDGWAPGPGTVLITGGTGALGSQVARRLAARGAEHLLLVSRRGDTAPGAAELVAELTASGAKATVAACDVGDADALRALVASIPAAYPLASVFHTAAVLDDAAISALTPEQVNRVLRVKADAAWRLHELTRDLELSAFVLFSSLAGTVGMVGQGNYAPGNAYVDALARHRRSRGLVATSVAWGSWGRGGMAERDAVTELRLRHGVPLLPPESAIRALEAALADGETALVIADVDWDRFAHAYTAARPSHLLDEIPEARRALGPVDGAGAGAPGGDTVASLRDRLADAKPEERERRLLDAVRGQVAAVLGHDSAEAVGTRRPFLELGLDSVTAVELRNRLGSVTGLRLPATMIFDFPTVAELVGYLSTQLFPGTAPDTSGPDGAVEAATSDGTAELDRLERLLGTLPSDAPARSEIADRLRRLLRSAVDSVDTVNAVEEPVASEDLEAATNDELFDYIEKEFGIS